MTTPCLICHRPVIDYDPMYCCNGADCGCRGLPTNPCLCSKKCGDALFAGIGKSYEQRRLDAGIEIYEHPADQRMREEKEAEGREDWDT